MRKFLILFVFILMFNACSSTQKETEPTPFEEVIASFKTPVLDKTANRVNNLRIAAETIDGYVVNPDEIFSFNEVVGERSVENGYKEAAIIIDDEKELGIGGGICQISSTVYNAAVLAGMEVIERHQHSKNVGYIELGKDATISGDLDLKLKNVGNAPLKITIGADDNEVVANIWKMTNDELF